MKFKFLFASLLLLLMSFATFAQNAKEPYVVIDLDGVATFYYNNSKPQGALSIQRYWDDPSWPNNVRESVKKVVFDLSFNDYKPTVCSYWFHGYSNLTEITGMKEYLHTENVTDMQFMFDDCRSLISLDLSNFNTANVKNMQNMFCDCRSLIFLDVSNFNTAKVTSMSFMFNDCSSLTTLDLNSFDTKNVTNMYCMFSACNSLTTLDVSNFNTENVTDMENMFDGCERLTNLDLSSFKTPNLTITRNMFYNCSRLTTIDLSNFNTANVTNMETMFFRCYRLNTIFVGDDWSTASLTDPNKTVFWECNQIYGGKGSKSSKYGRADYAHIDGGTDNPGYLTKSGEPAYVSHFSPYAVIRGNTVTFYFDEKKIDGALPLRTEQDDKNWTSDICTSIANVRFDDSFYTFTPTKLSYWFYGMSNLSQIDFDHLYTGNVEYMDAMFQFCKSLYTLDLSGFNTAIVTNMTRLFSGCEKLESVFVGKNWSTASVAMSSGMFKDCLTLYGGKGTFYNPDFTDCSYAIIDGGTENPGYLTQSGELAFKRVNTVMITTLPVTEYTVGDDFSPENGILTVTFNTGETETVELSKADIYGYEKNKVGEQILRVYYRAFKNELTVIVKEKTPTPVSDISDIHSVKVWSSNRTIFIESAPDTKYTIIDLSGRTIKSATTKSTKEEININKPGVYVVVINGESFKVAVQ